MSRELTLGSLFDGSGGFSLGAKLSGIKPVWSSEIEPFCIRITEKNLPDVKHYGDVSRLSGYTLEPVDIITFGSPCQDMSIAGRRAGLDGSRSCLFYQAVRIITEMREQTHGKYPRFAVWENVPGCFSSNSGEDFKSVLEALCWVKDETVSVPKPDKWGGAGSILGDDFSIAWKVLDAQYYGVPQRRARIYLVADFDGQSAGEILFESEGLSGYSAESFRAWQETTRYSEDGARTPSKRESNYVINPQGNSGISITEDQVGTLIAQDHGHHPVVLDEALSVENHPIDGRIKIREDGTVQTLCARCGTGGMNCPLVAEPAYGIGKEAYSGGEKANFNFAVNEEVSPTLQASNGGAVGKLESVTLKQAFGVCSKSSHSMLSDKPEQGFYEAETSRTLDQMGGNPVCNQGGIAVVEKHETWCSTTGKFVTISRGIANPLCARDYKDAQVVNLPLYIVRRLTPLECCRLQGFPDYWCDDLAIPEPTDEQIQYWLDVWNTWQALTDGKPKTEKQVRKWLSAPNSDSAQYRMWGNGVALPCVIFVLSGVAWAVNK